MMKKTANKRIMKQKRPQKPQKPQPTWNQVKLEGKVLSHDHASFEGFTSLQVLEKYDKRFVKKAKIQRDDLNLRQVDKFDRPKKEKQPKVKKEDSGLESEDDIFAQFDEDDAPPRPPPTKKRALGENNKKSKKKGKVTPGRFVLLKPESESEDSFDEMDDFDEADGEEIMSDSNEDNDEGEEIPNLINLKSWQELGVPDEILKAIVDKGFTCPTEIQSSTIPSAILGKRDILGAAETGSGKTLAFGIPIIDGILKYKKRSKTDEKELFAVVLTPTRELASQIHDHLKEIAKYTGIKIASIFGGLATVKQKRVLKQCPEIVIATPGRLWELIEEGDEHLNKINAVKYFVVDETDRMVEKGHFEELQKLLVVLNEDEENVKNRQNFIFSATLTMVHDLPDYVLSKFKFFITSY